jgi:hypothetical protein
MSFDAHCYAADVRRCWNRCFMVVFMGGSNDQRTPYIVLSSSVIIF